MELTKAKTWRTQAKGAGRAQTSSPPLAEFPLLRSLAPALAAYGGAAELERGLDILLTGLAATLTPHPT